MVFPVEMEMEIEKHVGMRTHSVRFRLKFTFCNLFYQVILCFFIFVKEGVQTGPLLSKLVYPHSAPCVPGDCNTIQLHFFSFTKKEQAFIQFDLRYEMRA